MTDAPVFRGFFISIVQTGGAVYSIEKCKQISSMVKDMGVDATAQKMGVTRESIRRAVRRMSVAEEKPSFLESEMQQFQQFVSRFTPEERAAIVNGRSINRDSAPRPVITFDSEEICIGFCTDTHMGAKHFLEHYWTAFLEECDKQGVDMILHGGDLIEGMSNRPDQVYSLDYIGYSAQMDYATELLSMTSTPIKIIDGNHDRWGIKSGGILAVKDVASRLDHVEFLGHDMGSVSINGTEWMMVHGEDAGGSYAYSYRAQKIVEAFKGGYKPNVLFTGHDHKAFYIFPRNVHTVGGGALCTQSAWMRSTRKENHDGFWIIRAGIADNEIKWFAPRFYPFY